MTRSNVTTGESGTLQLLISGLGAAGIGGIAGAWIAQSGSRREARAKAVAALAEMERVAWMRRAEFEQQRESVPAFHTLKRDLRSAALLAQVPLAAIDNYIAHMALIRWVIDTNGEREVKGTIRDLGVASTKTVTSCVWHPWWGRIAGAFRIWRITSAGEQGLTPEQRKYLAEHLRVG